MNSNQKIKSESDNNIESFELIQLLNIFIRNKLLISTFTLVCTFIAIIFSSLMKPIYKGSFEIVVKNDKPTNALNKALYASAKYSFNNDSKTQEFILKSPSVLKPVHRFALDKYQMRNDKDLTNISYKWWVASTLKINFKQGTDILSISFMDNDKDFIIETLKKISERYQNYTRVVKERELNNLLSHLRLQEEEFKEKSLKSKKELNKFSIENGLGDVDGFVALGNQNKKLNLNGININNTDLSKINNLTPNFSKSKSKAGQRFSKQFSLLEEYEAQYTNYSSKLKPNSITLKNLKLKIENLRSSLKRPNEILIKYQELVKTSQRDESLLSSIEEEKIMTEIELARQKNPWQIISKPTIDETRVSPNRTKISLISFLGSLITIYLISYLKERISGKIFELSELKKYIDADFLETIYLKNTLLSKKLFDSLLKRVSINKNIKDFALIEYPNNRSSINSLLNSKENYYISDFENEELIKLDNIFIFINDEEITKKDCFKLNKYINIFDKKIQGWIYLDSKTQI